MHRVLGVVLVGIVAAALFSPAFATAAPKPKTTLLDVENEVMCPVCGTPLDLATDAPLANKERALIRRLIARGYSKEQIKRRLVQEFGPGVLALPPKHGFDLAAYLVPIMVGLAGLILLILLALRWRRRAPQLVPATGMGGVSVKTKRIEPADASRLDEDLARYET
jgi:cytochrome c-type biogenesis protein CcmH/NrfF